MAASVPERDAQCKARQIRQRAIRLGRDPEPQAPSIAAATPIVEPSRFGRVFAHDEILNAGDGTGDRGDQALLILPVGIPAAHKIGPDEARPVVDLKVCVALKFRRVFAEFLANRIAHCMFNVVDTSIVVSHVVGAHLLDIRNPPLQLRDRRVNLSGRSELTDVWRLWRLGRSS